VARASLLAPILPTSVYPLAVFKMVSGWGDKAMREARRTGLRVVHAHGRGFVRGCDFIRYIDQLAEAQSAQPGKDVE